MNTPILNEAAVLVLMRQEHARLSAVTDELWQRLKVAEEAMAPLKADYDKLLNAWSDAHRLTDALEAILKAKETQKVSA